MSAPHPRLPNRSIELFPSAYLTLASIIQGVALAALVQRVESTYLGFDATNWFLSSATFLVILIIWHEYLMMVLGYVWVPTLVDSIVPFAFVAGELFMAHFVASDERAWLLAYAATLVVGLVAWVVTSVQAKRHIEENREILEVAQRQQRFRGALLAGITILAVAGWALYAPLKLQHVQTGVAIVALVSIVLFAASSLSYWNRLGRRANAASPLATHDDRSQ